jgi:hypothetical protein
MTQYRGYRQSFDAYPIVVGLVIVGIAVAMVFGIVHTIQARENCERQHGVYLTWKGGDACIVDGKFSNAP